MEDLRKIADAHYKASPRQVRAKAVDFFNELDSRERGYVSLHDFLAFMSTAGHPTLSKPSFFKDLDRDRDGKLDFKDVLTLYYIIMSKRPICGQCNNLILGIFFSCINCRFDSSRGIFTLCISCYRSKLSDHSHDGVGAMFLDAYTFLEKKRSDAVETRMRRENTSQENRSIRTPKQGQTSNAIIPYGGHRTQQGQTSSNALVRHGHGQSEKWNRALKTLASAVTIAGCVANSCSIL